MFSENNKISLRQLKRLMVLELFSVSGIIVPRIAAVASGRDGAISIIIATLYAFLYAFIIILLTRGMKGDYFHYAKNQVGSILTIVIGLLYMLKFFLCSVFAARLFSEVIKETLLEDTDNRIIILLLILMAAYGASKGLEVRARIAEILYFIVVIPFFIFLILGLYKVDYTNLMPILTEKTGTILYGGYEVFLTFSVIELLLFVVPFIKYTQKDKKEGKKLSSYVGSALAIVGILNLLFFIVSLGILGEKGTKQTLWSMVYMIQVVKFPGGFIQRQDAIILSIWMLSIFILLSGFLFYIGVIGKRIFRVPSGNYLLIPFIIFIFGAAATEVNTDEFYDYFSFYMKFIGIPQSIIIPAFLVFVGKLKNITLKKSSAVRGILLLFTVGGVLTLTGCKDMTEINDRNFIQAMGMDYKDGKLIVYYVLPDLEAQTGQKSEESDSFILSFEGENFMRIEEEYQLRYNKKQDFSHIKAIVFGNEFAKNADVLNEFVLYASDKYELGKNTLLFVSSGEANGIIELNGELEGGIGEYLERLYKINLANSDKKEVTLGDFIRGMNNENEVVRIPVVTEKEKRVETAGLALFLQFALCYQADAVEGDYIELAGGHGKDNRFFFPQSEDLEYVIRLNYLRRKVDYSFNNQTPHVKITLEGSGKIEKGVVLGNDMPTRDMFYTNKTSTARSSLAKEIEDICNEQIKNKILSNMEQLLKEEGIDYLNLYRLSAMKQKEIWKAYEGEEDRFINDLTYEVGVRFYMN